MVKSFPIHSACILFGMGLLLVLAASGCGADEGNSVSGQVKLDGKSLTAGLVTFVGQEGDKTPISSIIQENGSYSIPRAPLGQVKISVQGPGHPSGGNQAAPSIVLPSKYGNADSSGLTYTVTKGKQTHDIALAP